MPVKTYKITLRNQKGLPATVTVPRLAEKFTKGKPLVTSSVEKVRYAKRRPNMFCVELVEHGRLVQGARVDTAVEPEKIEPVDSRSPTEVWYDLCSEAGDSGPTVKKIKIFALENDIDLSECSVKADMVDLVEETLEEKQLV